MPFRIVKAENTSFATPQEMFQDNKLKNIIIKIATKPKMCDNCKKLIRKGGSIGWRYECRYDNSEKSGFTERFDRCPKYCQYYDPKEF